MKTAIVLTNPKAATANGTLSFFKSDGTPMAVMIGGATGLHRSVHNQLRCRLDQPVSCAAVRTRRCEGFDARHNVCVEMLNEQAKLANTRKKKSIVDELLSDQLPRPASVQLNQYFEDSFALAKTKSSGETTGTRIACSPRF
ncbi:MAG: hypothetical protein HY646_05910 [Acidobacteria bacterium]|nr:hypothetical protein [Acidobacteriota bacterium]